MIWILLLQALTDICISDYKYLDKEEDVILKIGDTRTLLLKILTNWYIR